MAGVRRHCAQDSIEHDLFGKVGPHSARSRSVRLKLQLAGIMAPRVYCTYFDHNYLSRGLALYFSLRRHAPGARLWVLCLTDACHKTLMALNLPDLVACRLADFEAADLEVAATR